MNKIDAGDDDGFLQTFGNFGKKVLKRKPLGATGIIVVALGIVFELFSLRDKLASILEDLGLYVPPHSLLAALAGIGLMLLVTDQLLRKRYSDIQQMQVHAWRKGSRLRHAWWSAFILLAAATPVSSTWLWHRHFASPYSRDNVVVYVDPLETKGWEGTDWARRIEMALRHELSLLFPEVRLNVLRPPKGVKSQQERLEWACSDGNADLVVYGSGDETAIWPELKYCSEEEHIFQVDPRTFAITTNDASELLASHQIFPTMPRDEAIRVCMVEKAVPERLSYIALLAIGAICMRNDLPGLEGYERFERAQTIFHRALELEDDTAGCRLNYCEAVMSFAAATICATNELDLTTASVESLREADSLLLSIKDSQPGLVAFLSGYLRAYLRRYDDALESFDTALAYRPTEAGSWTGRSFCLYHLERYPEALASADSALGCDPGAADALVMKGHTYYRLGQVDDALDSYRRAIRISGGHTLARAYCAAVLESVGRFDEALEMYDSFLYYRPEWSGIWNNRGLLLLDAGFFQQALISFDTALVYDRDFLLAWNNRGLALARMGRYREAIESFDSAVLRDACYLSALENKAYLLRSMREYDGAVRCYHQLLSCEPDNSTVWTNTGVTLMQLGRLNEAINHFDSALKYDYSLALAWFNRSLILLRVEDFAQAAASCDSALTYDSTLAPAHTLRLLFEKHIH